MNSNTDTACATWHTVVAATEELQRLLGSIRDAGGTITRSCPSPAGFVVTYITHGS